MKEQTIKEHDGIEYCDDNYMVFEVEFSATKTIEVEVEYGTALIEVRGTKEQLEDISNDHSILTEMIISHHNRWGRKLSVVDAAIEKHAERNGFDAGELKVLGENTEITDIQLTEIETGEPFVITGSGAEYSIETDEFYGDNTDLEYNGVLQKVQMITGPPEESISYRTN